MRSAISLRSRGSGRNWTATEAEYCKLLKIFPICAPLLIHYFLCLSSEYGVGNFRDDFERGDAVPTFKIILRLSNAQNIDYEFQGNWV
jgi:hypothetical protein